MGAPATLPANFDGWDKTAPPASLPADFNQWDAPKQETAAMPSAAVRLRDNFMSGLGITDNESAKKFFTHPVNTLIGALEGQGQLAVKAKEAAQRGDYKGALMYGLNYLVPFIGQQTAKAGEQLNEGDYAGGIGRTLGVAVPIVAGSPEVRGVAGGALKPVMNAVKPAVAKAAGVASDIVDPELTGIVSPRLAHVQRSLGKLAEALEKSKQTHAAVEAVDNPGAPLPEAPAPELVQANSLLKPGSVAPPNPADVLGGIPNRMQMPAATILRSSPDLPAAFNGPGATYKSPVGSVDNPFQSPGELQSPILPDAFQPRPPQYQPPVGTVDNPFRISTQAFSQAVQELGPKTPVATIQMRAAEIEQVLKQKLGEALGSPPPGPNEPIFSRGGVAEQAQPKPQEGLLEGHTPLKSSALNSYKYDPQTQEFEADFKGSSTPVRYGGVSPEQVKYFEEAPSQGKAFQAIKNSATVIAKRINGKWRPVKAPTPVTGDDLTSILQESLRQAQATK